MITRCMRNACWITEATDTHSEYVLLIVFQDKNGHANAPECYVDMYIACLAMYYVCAVYLKIVLCSFHF
jgi:hypothetical protein